MTKTLVIHGCIFVALSICLSEGVLASGTGAIELGQLTATQAIAQAQPVQDSAQGTLQLSELLPASADRQKVSGLIQLVLLITVVSLAPAIIVMLTCFTRIIVVLSLTRQALGTAQLPPTQILFGLAIILTILIMAPTFSKLNDQALKPYLSGQITAPQAVEQGQIPLRAFMIRQIDAYDNQADVWMFLEHTGLRGQENSTQLGPVLNAPESTAVPTWADVPTRALVPAFVISELKTAFLMGFKIYLPFLVIDMVVASILISMGMLMLPPVLVSLPFKILLFVLVDGWHLLAGSLLESFAR